MARLAGVSANITRPGSQPLYAMYAYDGYLLLQVPSRLSPAPSPPAPRDPGSPEAAPTPPEARGPRIARNQGGRRAAGRAGVGPAGICQQFRVPGHPKLLTKR